MKNKLSQRQKQETIDETV